MADDQQQKSQPQAQSQPPQQDSREQISKRVDELRKEVYEQLETEEFSANPGIVERINQIFNDTMAAIPPDVQEPKYQRATILTTMTKLKTQVTGALQNAGVKEEQADQLKGPFEEAEQQAKQEAEAKNIQQPAGPSQSPQNPAPPTSEEVGQSGYGQQPAQFVQTPEEQPPEQTPQPTY